MEDMQILAHKFLVNFASMVPRIQLLFRPSAYNFCGCWDLSDQNVWPAIQKWGELNVRIQHRFDLEKRKGVSRNTKNVAVL